MKAAVRTGGYMKKIIGAMLAGSLLAGMAAADPAFKLQYRMRGDVVKQTATKDNGKTTNIMDLDGYGANADTFNIASSTDKAGVSLTLWPSVNGEGTKSVSIDEYYGWATIVDGLTLKAGAFNDRHAARLNTNKTDLTLLDSQKLGVWNGLKGVDSTSVKLQGYDASNFGTSTDGQTLGVEYSKDGLLLRAAAMDTENKYSEFTDDKDTTNVESGYMAELAYKADGVIGEFDVLWRTNHTSNNVIGAYWMPAFAEGLESTFGFTYEMNAENTGLNKYEYNAWGADARVRYAVTDAAGITAHFNYTSVKVKDVDAETGMYVLGGVYYVASDAITLNCDAGLYYADLDDNDKTDKGENTFSVFPSVKFVPAKGAALSAGLKYTGALNTGDVATTTKSIIEVPFVFRVKL